MSSHINVDWSIGCSVFLNMNAVMLCAIFPINAHVIIKIVPVFRTRTCWGRVTKSKTIEMREKAPIAVVNAMIAMMRS